MPRVDDEIRATPSLLDRLVDDPDDRAVDNRYALRDLKRAVARDLEALLNTRRELLENLPSDYSEVSRSLLTYGLPDFSALNLVNHGDRMRIRRMLEEAIAEGEPRLERVRVSVDDPRPFDRGLRFHIEAMLKVEPVPEPVTFDAVLQFATQECRLEGNA
jgi:type VI secretion system protein ImpF